MSSLFFAGIQLLHVPDGFLNIPISVICWVVTLIVLYFAVKQAQQDFDERLVPLRAGESVAWRIVERTG